MDRHVYFDHAATTPVRPEAIAAAVSAMETDFGNPSSGHPMGQRARSLIDNARQATAEALGCAPEEIYFTSGGTEANGLVFAPHARGHIVITALEHPAVSEAATLAKSRGAELTVAAPEPDGHMSLEAITAALRENTTLVSAMLVCNETGAVLPVSAIADAVRKRCPSALIHTDMVQGFLKLPVNIRKLGVDFAVLSGHKIGAPKGIGALYIRKGVNLRPLLRGGGQENGLRPGTEAVPLIAAFGAAVRAGLSDFNARTRYMEELKQYALSRLDVTFIPPHDAPHILAFALPGCPGQVAQRMLGDMGFMVSTGSACSRGKKSSVLLSMKQSPAVVESALRLSFGHEHTKDDIDALALALDSVKERFGRA